ncbi:hypothetical protein Glove_1033g23 [Diversispora epigaea]|uniref:Uncharacterized protein n=1 Tax=Diversispora epigaea TaxID=1348612 RepID=A0A397G0E6_9GLOM|nr:hypothetical protein Glove_1033g23 [Diversispora epigaea]
MSIRPKGSDDNSSNSSTSVPSIGLYNCFRGQMTASYMLNEVLTIEQTSTIYELGLNHFTQFESEQKIDNSTIICNLIDGTLEKCSTLNLRNAIQCLGDVEILFSMLMRFDDVSLQVPFGSLDNFFSSVGQFGPRHLSISAFQSIEANEDLTREIHHIFIHWYKQSEISEPHRHQSTGVTRPKPSQIKELRGILLTIIIISYFKDGIYKDQV